MVDSIGFKKYCKGMLSKKDLQLIKELFDAGFKANFKPAFNTSFKAAFKPAFDASFKPAFNSSFVNAIKPVRDDIRKFRKKVEYMFGYMDRDLMDEKKRTDKIVEHLNLPRKFGYES